MNDLKTWLENMALIYKVIAILFSGGILTFFAVCWRYIRVQWRFGKNLRRKIYFLKTAEEEKIKTARGNLADLKMFNIVNDIKDVSNNTNSLQSLAKNAVYIVRYSSHYPAYKELFDFAKHKDNIPIIIFADQGEIKPDSGHWEIFNGYIYCDVANTTNRLAVILLNILKIV